MDTSANAPATTTTPHQAAHASAGGGAWDYDRKPRRPRVGLVARSGHLPGRACARSAALNAEQAILDAAARDPAMRAVVEAWLRVGRITTTPGRLGRELRDRHLRRARALVETTTTLFISARRFESAVWPRWRHLPEPPTAATALHRELWAARKGAEFPDSLRQYERIISS